MLKKKLYDLSPVLIQNFLTSLYGAKLIKARYNKTYYEHLNFLRNNFYTIDHKEIQMKNLNEFLKVIKEQSPYYQKFLKNVKLPLTKIEELEKLPQMSKEIIRNSLEEIITISKEEGIASFTGGTTGKSLNVYYTKEDIQKRMAFLDFFKERHGVYKGMRRASFTGKNLVPLKQKTKCFWRYNKPLNQLLFSSFHLTKENIPYYIKELNKFKPESMDGFPSVMFNLAQHIIKNNIVLEFVPKAIFPTAETLTDYERQIIEKAFKSKVRNQYASSEGAPFITECPQGNLHLDIITGVFEKKVKENNTSGILVTAFETKGTPLLRYDIGDVLEFSNDKCSCEYKTPIVNKIVGRDMDVLYSMERGKISNANMSNTIKSLPNSVVNIQFIQSELDTIVIKIVRDEKLFKKSHEEEIINETKIRLGEKLIYKVEYVKDIPVEKSGKFRMIKNTLPPELMD